MTSCERVFVAGHNGMVGRAIAARLRARGTAIITRTRSELDLVDQAAVRAFFSMERPDGVIIAAARVGGIQANATYPAEFIHQNLMIAANIIGEAHRSGVGRLLNLASSAIYPRETAQPMREDALFTGPLDPAHEPYSTAKIAAIKLCESYNRQYGTDFRSIVPTNLYGPGDHFDPVNSHVVPAMMRRFHEAAAAGQDEVVIWGSGKPRRELLHVDDMADAALFVFDLPEEIHRTHTDPMLSHVNVGLGTDVSILELAETMARVTGFRGRLVFDREKPDGTMRKLLDVTRMTQMGWRAGIELETGLSHTYAWYLANLVNLRGI